MSELFKCRPEDINEKTVASDFELWDSLNNITLLIYIEKLFNIRFTGLEATSLENVGELVDLIELKKSET